jgi:hypothetical protein
MRRATKPEPQLYRPRQYASELIQALIHQRDTQAIRDRIVDPATRAMAEQLARSSFQLIQFHARASVASLRYYKQLPASMHPYIDTYLGVRGQVRRGSGTNERLRNPQRRPARRPR